MQFVVDDAVLEIAEELVDITPAWVPDSYWSFTDKEGHTHEYKYVITNRGGHYVCPETIGWEGDRPEGHYICLECGDTVVPGMIPSTWKQQEASGKRRYFYCGREITEEQANLVVAYMEFKRKLVGGSAA